MSDAIEQSTCYDFLEFLEDESLSNYSYGSLNSSFNDMFEEVSNWYSTTAANNYQATTGEEPLARRSPAEVAKLAAATKEINEATTMEQVNQEAAATEESKDEEVSPPQLVEEPIPQPLENEDYQLLEAIFENRVNWSEESTDEEQPPEENLEKDPSYNYHLLKALQQYAGPLPLIMDPEIICADEETWNIIRRPSSEPDEEYLSTQALQDDDVPFLTDSELHEEAVAEKVNQAKEEIKDDEAFPFPLNVRPRAIINRLAAAAKEISVEEPKPQLLEESFNLEDDPSYNYHLLKALQEVAGPLPYLLNPETICCDEETWNCIYKN